MRCISLAAESDDMLYSVDNQLHRAILQCNTFAQQYQHLGPFLFNNLYSVLLLYVPGYLHVGTYVNRTFNFMLRVHFV